MSAPLHSGTWYLEVRYTAADVSEEPASSNIYPDDGSISFLQRSVGLHIQDYKATHPARELYSSSALR
jgi:hypothetical protein